MSKITLGILAFLTIAYVGQIYYWLFNDVKYQLIGFVMACLAIAEGGLLVGLWVNFDNILNKIKGLNDE